MLFVCFSNPVMQAQPDVWGVGFFRSAGIFPALLCHQRRRFPWRRGGKVENSPLKK